MPNTDRRILDDNVKAVVREIARKAAQAASLAVINGEI